MECEHFGIKSHSPLCSPFQATDSGAAVSIRTYSIDCFTNWVSYAQPRPFLSLTADVRRPSYEVPYGPVGGVLF